MFISHIKSKQTSLWYRLCSGFIAVSFVLSSVVPPSPVYAQSTPLAVLNLPAPGAMVQLTSGFTPPLVKGITINPDNPLQFDFLISPGDHQLSGNAFRAESKKLIKYFLAGLTVPDEEMWVNLSPYEQHRIIADQFGQTEMGRDLLAQDYILKQLTASLMYPEGDLGSKFWERVYSKALEQYGATDIPMNTFNKIWIIPEKAIVYEREHTAFVVESHLKVMLEEDYLALSKNAASNAGLSTQDQEVVSGTASEIVKEILVPEIEKEVNEGEMFTQLRQIYNSIILATWYKNNLKESLLGKIYVNQGKTKGVHQEDIATNQGIYDQYVEAFNTGVFNYIKEDYDPLAKDFIPRKYFSGGANLRLTANEDSATGFGNLKNAFRTVHSVTGDQAIAASSEVYEVEVDLLAANDDNYAAASEFEEAQNAASPIAPISGEFTDHSNNTQHNFRLGQATVDGGYVALRFEHHLNDLDSGTKEARTFDYLPAFGATFSMVDGVVMDSEKAGNAIPTIIRDFLDSEGVAINIAKVDKKYLETYAGMIEREDIGINMDSALEPASSPLTVNDALDLALNQMPVSPEKSLENASNPQKNLFLRAFEILRKAERLRIEDNGSLEDIAEQVEEKRAAAFALFREAFIGMNVVAKSDFKNIAVLAAAAALILEAMGIEEVSTPWPGQERRFKSRIAKGTNPIKNRLRLGFYYLQKAKSVYLKILKFEGKNPELDPNISEDDIVIDLIGYQAGKNGSRIIRLKHEMRQFQEGAVLHLRGAIFDYIDKLSIMEKGDARSKRVAAMTEDTDSSSPIRTEGIVQRELLEAKDDLSEMIKDAEDREKYRYNPDAKPDPDEIALMQAQVTKLEHELAVIMGSQSASSPIHQIANGFHDPVKDIDYTFSLEISESQKPGAGNSMVFYFTEVPFDVAQGTNTKFEYSAPDRQTSLWINGKLTRVESGNFITTAIVQFLDQNSVTNHITVEDRANLLLYAVRIRNGYSWDVEEARLVVSTKHSTQPETSLNQANDQTINNNKLIAQWAVKVLEGQLEGLNMEIDEVAEEQKREPRQGNEEHLTQLRQLRDQIEVDLIEARRKLGALKESQGSSPIAQPMDALYTNLIGLAHSEQRIGDRKFSKLDITQDLITGAIAAGLSHAPENATNQTYPLAAYIGTLKLRLNGILPEHGNKIAEIASVFLQAYKTLLYTTDARNKVNPQNFRKALIEDLDIPENAVDPVLAAVHSSLDEHLNAHAFMGRLMYSSEYLEIADSSRIDPDYSAMRDEVQGIIIGKMAEFNIFPKTRQRLAEHQAAMALAAQMPASAKGAQESPGAVADAPDLTDNTPAPTMNPQIAVKNAIVDVLPIDRSRLHPDTQLMGNLQANRQQVDAIYSKLWFQRPIGLAAVSDDEFYGVTVQKLTALVSAKENEARQAQSASPVRMGVTVWEGDALNDMDQEELEGYIPGVKEAIEDIKSIISDGNLNPYQESVLKIKLKGLKKYLNRLNRHLKKAQETNIAKPSNTGAVASPIQNPQSNAIETQLAHIRQLETNHVGVAWQIQAYQEAEQKGPLSNDDQQYVAQLDQIQQRTEEGLRLAKIRLKQLRKKSSSSPVALGSKVTDILGTGPRIHKLLHDQFNVPYGEMEDSKALMEYDIGSLDQLDLIGQVEEEFEINIDDSDISKIVTLGDLVEITEEALSKASSPVTKDVGGINLNPAMMDLEIKRDGNGVPLPFELQPAEVMQIEGLIPVIINITPVLNVPLYLGFADPQAEEETAFNPGLGPMKATEPEQLSYLN